MSGSEIPELPGIGSPPMRDYKGGSLTVAIMDNLNYIDSYKTTIAGGTTMGNKAVPVSLKYTNNQLIGLSLLRVLIGWHLLYEGVAKLLNPYWSSAAYLLDVQWIFSGLAKSIVANPVVLGIVDYLNMWGLTLIGLALMLGLLGRYASIAGMVLLLIYYFFTPPLLGLEYSRPWEGSYIIVNKNLIEACALYVLYVFPTSNIIGLDRLIFRNNTQPTEDLLT